MQLGAGRSQHTTAEYSAAAPAAEAAAGQGIVWVAHRVDPWGGCLVVEVKLIERRQRERWERGGVCAQSGAGIVPDRSCRWRGAVRAAREREEVMDGA